MTSNTNDTGHGIAPKQTLANQGTIPINDFDLPTSCYLSETSLKLLKQQEQASQALASVCPEINEKEENIDAIRQCSEKYYYPKILKHYQDRYNVIIEPQTIAGVYTETITPATGIPPENQHLVLINLHGGGFKYGARWAGQFESIPIAALANIKVISIDYRLAPEHTFPAASEDVAAVYAALLNDYQPENMGIYGTSAGGLLTAQSIAWFLEQNIPLPAAIGMFCAGAYSWSTGDSSYMTQAIYGSVPSGSLDNPYFKGSSQANNPLIYPGCSEATLKHFVPSLLISATRDYALSSVVHTHTQLNRLAIPAELYIWEGLGHGFHVLNPDLPQSREACNVIVKFFKQYLGKQ